MKRKILGMLFCLIAFSVYAAAPAFDGGVVVPVEKISKISFVNYSGLNEIDIEFFIYKETEWVSAGKITECPFTKEIKLATKESFSKIFYVAYKCNLPADKRIFVDSSSRELVFYVLEASNTAFKTTSPFSDVKEDPANGFYKFDTTVQRRHYEEDVRVKNAPKCIIMFQSPKLPTWEIYGIVDGGKLKVVTSYHKDIDRCLPYWIISVCEEHKAYTIVPYTKHNDLYFEFAGLNEVITPEPDDELDTVEAKPAVASEDDMEAQLLKLKQLYDGGLIDEDEYKEKKSKVLGL